MFPLYPSGTTNDPAFFISSNVQQDADTDTIPQDLVLDYQQYSPQNQVHDFTGYFPNNFVTVSNSEPNFVPIREAFSYNRGDDKTERDDRDSKKKMHRDLERLRRKEMNSLYATLRSLIPLEYIKGKRSISDQMHEASEYINHKQAKIKELEAKRDKLKRISSWNNALEADASGSDPHILSRLSVRSCLGGVEVVFTSDFGDKNLTLSEVLRALNEEGLEIASCVSTKTNGSLLHTIQSEACDDSQTALDIAGLRRKLAELLI